MKRFILFIIVSCIVLSMNSAALCQTSSDNSYLTIAGIPFGTSVKNCMFLFEERTGIILTEYTSSDGNISLQTPLADTWSGSPFIEFFFIDDSLDRAMMTNFVGLDRIEHRENFSKEEYLKYIQDNVNFFSEMATAYESMFDESTQKTVRDEKGRKIYEYPMIDGKRDNDMITFLMEIEESISFSETFANAELILMKQKEICTISTIIQTP